MGGVVCYFESSREVAVYLCSGAASVVPFVGALTWFASFVVAIHENLCLRSGGVCSDPSGICIEHEPVLCKTWCKVTPVITNQTTSQELLDT